MRAVSAPILLASLLFLGGSFWLDEARREVALKLVGLGDHSLAEVAFLTGFSEQSAFTRAFKRWSGTTPRHYRKSDLESRAMQA